MLHRILQSLLHHKWHSQQLPSWITTLSASQAPLLGNAWKRAMPVYCQAGLLRESNEEIPQGTQLPGNWRLNLRHQHWHTSQKLGLAISNTVGTLKGSQTRQKQKVVAWLDHYAIVCIIWSVVHYKDQGLLCSIMHSVISVQDYYFSSDFYSFLLRSFLTVWKMDASIQQLSIKPKKEGQVGHLISTTFCHLSFCYS